VGAEMPPKGLSCPVCRAALQRSSARWQEMSPTIERYYRERLAAALKAGRIPADEDTISRVDLWLFSLFFAYRVLKKGYEIGFAKPSRELKNVCKALREWINSDSGNWEAHMIKTEYGYKMSSVDEFLESAEKLVGLLESEKKRVRQENLETYLFFELYRGYIELSGKKGLSDDGPAIRFVTKCASIVNVAVPRGLRRRIQLAIARHEYRARVVSPRNSDEAQDKPQETAWVHSNVWRPIDILRPH
jgi:hypothetical protein